MIADMNVIAIVSAIVCRCVTTSLPAWPTARHVNGRRLSRCNVSGRRRDQIISSTETTAGNQNTARHGRKAIRPAPTAGASTGTNMNTAMIIDISRAMVLPSWRSRIMAMLNERGPAAPTPHTKRAITTSCQVGAIAATAAATP
ncbi:unannotated protein [freshwater metagenome]|uniref:Unannotated protein n=1 Tax=freshwater metagenome TaxID=449393 RepID=A0A6J7AMX9_9ZZZZ